MEVVPVVRNENEDGDKLSESIKAIAVSTSQLLKVTLDHFAAIIGQYPVISLSDDVRLFLRIFT